MLRRLLAAVMILTSPAASARAAEAEVLAFYWARSATVAPAYAWSVDVVIRVDGQASMKRCTGYDTEGPNCETRTGTVAPAGLEAIKDAVIASGLIETPARAAEDHPVGGGTSGATVHVEGTSVELPPFPAEADVSRVSAVLNAINAAAGEAFGG